MTCSGSLVRAKAAVAHTTKQESWHSSSHPDNVFALESPAYYLYFKQADQCITHAIAAGTAMA